MKLILTVFIVSLLIILAFFGLTNPFELEPMNFLPIIAAVYALSYSSIFMCIGAFFDRIQKSQKKIVTAILGFIPTGLFALSTLNKLTAVEVLLIVLIPTIVAWYYLRLKR